jgi:hypothetical protein
MVGKRRHQLICFYLPNPPSNQRPRVANEHVEMLRCVSRQEGEQEERNETREPGRETGRNKWNGESVTSRNFSGMLAMQKCVFQNFELKFSA